MKSVYEIIAKIASELPSDCIRIAAKSLASGTQCDDAVSLWGGQLAHRKLIADFGAAARTAGLSSGEIAAALLSAATTAENLRLNAVTMPPAFRKEFTRKRVKSRWPASWSIRRHLIPTAHWEVWLDWGRPKSLE